VTYTYAAVENFAGGFSAGAALSGLKLIANRELPGGFGVPMMEANRPFLGDGWQTQVAEAEAWEPVRPDVQISNPPCSAFSGMTAGYAAHGMDSKINDCMWAAIGYAARCRPAVFIMESVSQAFTNGKPLMQKLAQELNEKSGLTYRTTHVIQDNYSLGGVTRRKRYFLVLSQVPFGVEVPELRWLPTVGDALSDLRSLSQKWESQLYDAPPTWWSHQLRSASGSVDGHYFEGNRRTGRLMDLVNGLRDAGEEPWLPGEPEEDIPRRYYERFGALPESWQYATPNKILTRDKQLLERGFKTGGFAQTRYWPWDKPGRVINGAGPHMVWHPDMRHATHREVARLMGFPDDWLISPIKNDSKLHSYWGKGTSVAPAQWICTWARESLDGNPGGVTGDQQPDGSYLVDVSKHWQAVEKRLTAPPRSIETLVMPAHVGKAGPRRPKTAPAPKTAAVRVISQTGDAPPLTAHRAVPKPVPEPRSDGWRASVPAGFRVRPEDEYIVREVFHVGTYRKLNMRAGDRVLDLGAHTGSFAVWACQRGAKRVTAVEMMPQTVELLRENTLGLPVDIWYGAVTPAAGDDAIAVLGKRANPMKASLLGTRFPEKPSITRYTTTAVPSFPMGDLIVAVQPNVIKFSVEASEGFIITPYAKDLAANNVRQVIGLHHISDERLLRKSRELHAAMLTAGYRASRDVPAKTSGWATTICYTLKSGN
jgi:FkbM family methyltransferase